MADVAARAGVSRSLVSTVFRGTPGASPETRARILAAADELGYRVDRRASLLRSRRTNVIGILVTPTAPYHAAVTIRLHDLIADRGYVPSIALLTDAQPLPKAAEALLSMGAEAIVVLGPHAGARASDCPVLNGLDRSTVVIAVDDSAIDPDFDAVRIDDARAMALAIDHLRDLGHEAIAHVEGTGHVSGPPRRAAYKRAMAERSLEPLVIAGGGMRADGARVAGEVRDAVRGGRATAVIAYNDETAFGILDALALDGLAAPRDLSIVGLDDLDEAALPHRSLTTVRQDPQVAAEAAMGLLERRLRGGERTGRVFTEPSLTVRGSTAPLPQPALR